MNMIVLNQIRTLTQKLSDEEKQELVKEIMATIEKPQEAKQPRFSWYGMLADLGPAPSAEDIDEVRREMWKNFPREDI